MAPAVERWPASFPAGPGVCFRQRIPILMKCAGRRMGENRPVLTTNLHFREGKPPEFCVNSTAAITPRFSMWLFSLHFPVGVIDVIGRYFRAITLLHRGMHLISLCYSLARYRRYRCYRQFRLAWRSVESNGLALPSVIARNARLLSASPGVSKWAATARPRHTQRSATAGKLLEGRAHASADVGAARFTVA